jgi:hypothetical protein
LSKLDLFLQAINQRRNVHVTVNTDQKGIIQRLCIPFDYGPSRKYKDGLDRYHFYDLDSPDGIHNLSILPEQLIEIKLTEVSFDPANYVTWKPNWIVKRDWGVYS